MGLQEDPTCCLIGISYWLLSDVWLSSFCMEFKLTEDLPPTWSLGEPFG